ncbi:hypothetical protein NEOLI_001377, partial [Neolecta irregularis DAH-3]
VHPARNCSGILRAPDLPSCIFFHHFLSSPPQDSFPVMESGDLTHHHHLCLHLQEPGCAQSSDTAGDFSGWDLGVGDHLSPYVSAHNSPLLGPASSASYSPPASAPRSLAGGDVFEWPQFTQSQSSSPHSNSHSHSHRRAYSDQLELGNSFAGWQPQAAFALGSLQLPIHLAPESDFDGAAGVLGSGGLYPSAIGSSDLGSSDFESGDLGPNDLYPPDLYPNDLYANDHLHSAPSLNPPVPPSITITPSDPVLPRHPVSVPRRARAHSDTSVRYDPHCPPLDDHHRRSFSSIRDHVLDLASDHHPRLAKNPVPFSSSPYLTQGYLCLRLSRMR